MTVINGKRVIHVNDHVRVVINPDNWVVEECSTDALGNESWRTSDLSEAPALIEVIRRLDRAGLLDDGLCDLREDVRPAPPAPVKEAFAAPLSKAVVRVQPRFTLVRPDEVPAGVAAEYYGPEVTDPHSYVAVNNLTAADFRPANWPRHNDSTWACVDTWGIQHPSNVEPEPAECLVWEPSSVEYTPNCASCGRTFGEHPKAPHSVNADSDDGDPF